LRPSKRAVRFFLVIFLTGLQMPPFLPGKADSLELPDLHAKLVDPVRFDWTPGFGDKILFSIRITNSGASLPLTTFHMKPFLLPFLATPNAPPKDGFVLPSKSVRLAIAGGNSVTVNYSGTLPKLPVDRYWVGAVIDSKNLVEEANELNNVTNGLDIGRNISQPHSPPNPSRLLLDLYSEIAGSIMAESGGASHNLRTIVRGTKIPEAQSEMLWARFMLVNLQTGQIWTLPYYEDWEVEKQFSALFWDPEGSRKWVDWYYQEPSVAGIGPGRYAFLTLIDSHDYFVETNETNNLDAHPLVMTPFEMADQPQEVWLVKRKADPQLPAHTLTLHNSYSTSVFWSSSVSPAASWLVTSPTSGELVAGGNLFVTIRMASVSLAPGTYKTNLRFAVASGPAQGASLEVPVTLFVHGTTAPVLQISPQILEASAPAGRHPPVLTFTITNTGSAPLLRMAVQDEDWITVMKPYSTSILPGATETVKVVIHPEGLEPDIYFGRIDVFSNASNDPEIVKVRYEVL